MKRSFNFNYGQQGFVITCLVSSVVMCIVAMLLPSDSIPEEEAALLLFYIVMCIMIAGVVGVWSWLGSMSEGVDKPPEPTLSKRRFRSFAEFARTVILPLACVIGMFILLVLTSAPSTG